MTHNSFCKGLQLENGAKVSVLCPQIFHCYKYSDYESLRKKEAGCTPIKKSRHSTLTFFKTVPPNFASVALGLL